ncbi:MAG TPA: hypothetical protein DCQ41_06755 [Cryomorphaceae bacterium]|nr:hypothetical protein [Cryomorphaceae bacterium]
MYITPWMSDIVVGTMRWRLWDAEFSTSEYEAIIAHSMELRFTTFDHADIYRDRTTEADFGAAAVVYNSPGINRKKLALNYGA